MLALEQGRDPAAVLDDLEPARHLAERVGEHLAVLAREDLGDLLAPRVQQLTDAEEELGPFRERGRPPGRESLPRCLDGRVDLLHARKVDGAGLAAGRGVEDRAAAAGAAVDPAPADPVRDARRSRCVDGLGHRGQRTGRAAVATLPAVADQAVAGAVSGMSPSCVITSTWSK